MPWTEGKLNAVRGTTARVTGAHPKFVADFEAAGTTVMNLDRYGLAA